ncbi:MAG: carboxypeptidase regulatory-like domain-containing protein [Gemmatimonadaceae bacterium]
MRLPPVITRALIALLFAPPLLAQAPSGVVMGRVRARVDSGVSALPASSAVAGATVALIGARVSPAITDGNGGFTLGSAPAGSFTLRVRRLGYRTADRAVTVTPNDTVRVEIVLEMEAQRLGPVHADAPFEVESFTAKPNVATIVMPARVMAGVPSVGEPDVVRVVQLLPGVSARNDFNTGLNVRGGASDQNLVLLDDIPIYNPFHLGGLFSTFMDATVGGIELMTGAFPARYDGRLSSVLDVHSAEDSRPGTHASADVSVLAATGRLAGTFADGKGTWSFAGRRTYADALASTFSKDNFPYHFLDLHGHASYTLPNDWRLAVTGYAGKDLLDLDIASAVGDSTVSRASSGTWKYDWGNRVIGATLSHDFIAPAGLGWLLGSRTAFEQRVSGSGFLTHLDVAEGAQTQQSHVRDLRVGGSLTAVGETHQRSLGYEVTTTNVRYASSSAQTGTTDFDIVQKPLSVAGWLQDVWHVSPSWLVEGGLRGERLTGGRDWAALSPRLAVKYFLTPSFALTAAAGRVTQTMHSLAGDGPLRFFELWLASDEYIPVETAWHYVVGAERRLEQSSIRVEGYFKKYDQVFDPNLSEDPSTRGDEFLPATGVAYGVDLLARWQSRTGFGGWLSYAYGLSSHERNGVRWAPGNDRRHDLNVVGTWQLARYRVGARFGFASGTPYTPITGQIVRRAYDPANDTWGTGNPPLYLEPLGGARNSARFPATHRLDVDASREMIFHGLTFAPYVSVVNAYNARNVFVYIYDYSTDRPTRRGYTQFPILPSLGVRLAF